MNYNLLYNKLITRAQDRILPDELYKEKHHILPRCMGGDDNPANIVFLTPEEHLLCHILLVKIYDIGGLYVALNYMLSDSSIYNPGRQSFNKKYGHWRRWARDNLKELKWWNNGIENKRSKFCPGHGWTAGMKNPAWNKGLKTGPNPKVSAALKGKDYSNKSAEAKENSGHKGTRWWNDGTKNKRSIDSPGKDWTEGFLVTSKGSSGMKWWNNGEKNFLSHICPEGCQKGRLKIVDLHQ